jgi:hypothetical protein
MEFVVALIGRNGRENPHRCSLFGFEARKQEIQKKSGLIGLHGRSTPLVEQYIRTNIGRQSQSGPD